MTDTPVHNTIAHFHAMYEGDVAWDACGCVANEVAVAALEGRTPDIGNAAKARARDLAAGKFTKGSGQTLADIAWDLEQRGYHNLEVIPYAEPANLDAIHQLIKDAGVAGDPVILEVSHAANLPDNEAGVAYHFVVSGGIDSSLGYLIANGDTRTAIAQHPAYPGTVPTNWATWSQLVNAGVCGAIRVKRNAPAPTPAPVAATAATTPPQVAQALAAVEAASQALAAVEAASQALATAQAALKAL